MFFLSWRQLMARKKQTVLILLGISFGTLLFVSISGVQLGMRAYMYEQFLNNTAHVLISGAENDIEPEEVTRALYGEDEPVLWVAAPAGKREEVRLENYQGWHERLSADPNVLDFSPRLSTNALLSNGKFSTAGALIGTIPDRQVRISTVEKYMKEGKFTDLQGGGNTIVIGSAAAEKLGVRLDQVITVSAGGGYSQPFKVVGMFHFGNKQVDESLAFAHLDKVQVLTRSQGRVTQIAVALYDVNKAPELADYWQMLSHDKVEDWQEANKMFMEMIRVQDFTRYFITASILIVAAFGIYNVLTIMINQKRREIAILRAIGYAPRRILALILYQGLLLGVSGGVAGMFFGFWMCKWIESIDLGFEFGGKSSLWITYDPAIYITAFITANIAALIASYIPAWEASRMTPMDIIRAE